MQSWSSWAQENRHGNSALVPSRVSSVRYVPASCFDIPGLEKAPLARTEGIFSSLLAPRRSVHVRLRCSWLVSLPPSGATLIEFETQSMLQSNCIVNQCLSKLRRWSGPSSRCAESGVQWSKLLLVCLHCSDYPLGKSLGVLRTFILIQTHWPEAQMLNCGCKKDSCLT